MLRHTMSFTTLTAALKLFAMWCWQQVMKLAQQAASHVITMSHYGERTLNTAKTIKERELCIRLGQLVLPHCW